MKTGTVHLPFHKQAIVRGNQLEVVINISHVQKMFVKNI